MSRCQSGNTYWPLSNDLFCTKTSWIYLFKNYFEKNIQIRFILKGLRQRLQWRQWMAYGVIGKKLQLRKAAFAEKSIFVQQTKHQRQLGGKR